MPERCVREAWSVQDATLITSIYAPHVSACSPRARANPKPGTSRQFALHKTHIKRDLALKPRVRGACPLQDIVLITNSLCVSNGPMLERRGRGVRLENLPAIYPAKNITNSTACSNRACVALVRIRISFYLQAFMRPQSSRVQTA